MIPATHQLPSVELFELLEGAAVEDAGQDLPHVEWHPYVSRCAAHELVRVVQGLLAVLGWPVSGASPVEVPDDVAANPDRVVLVIGQVVGEAAGACMHLGATESLIVSNLVDGHPHQRWATEVGAGLTTDHDHVVAHTRQVGATGGGWPEPDVDRRYALVGQVGQMLELGATGHEDVGLLCEVRAG